MATASETEGRPKDPFRDEQSTIRNWLQKPRMFEVERTGGMLALSEDPEPTHSEDPNCRHNLILCKSIQPQDPPAYSDIGHYPKVILGAIFTGLWVFCAFKLNAIRSKYRRQTRFAYVLIFVALVLFILAGGIALAIWWLWPSSAKRLTLDGDPMVLIQGVSVWPAVYIRVFTLGLTIFFSRTHGGSLTRIFAK